MGRPQLPSVLASAPAPADDAPVAPPLFPDGSVNFGVGRTQPAASVPGLAGVESEVARNGSEVLG